MLTQTNQTSNIKNIVDSPLGTSGAAFTASFLLGFRKGYS
jgi:uncharacterized membrane protein (Fun14 family)